MNKLTPPECVVFRGRWEALCAPHRSPLNCIKQILSEDVRKGLCGGARAASSVRSARKWAALGAGLGAGPSGRLPNRLPQASACLQENFGKTKCPGRGEPPTQHALRLPLVGAALGCRLLPRRWEPPEGCAFRLRRPAAPRPWVHGCSLQPAEVSPRVVSASCCVRGSPPSAPREGHGPALDRPPFLPWA